MLPKSRLKIWYNLLLPKSYSLTFTKNLFLTSTYILEQKYINGFSGNFIPKSCIVCLSLDKFGMYKPINLPHSLYKSKKQTSPQKKILKKAALLLALGRLRW